MREREGEKEKTFFCCYVIVVGVFEDPFSGRTGGKVEAGMIFLIHKKKIKRFLVTLLQFLGWNLFFFFSFFSLPFFFDLCSFFFLFHSTIILLAINQSNKNKDLLWLFD